MSTETINVIGFSVEINNQRRACYAQNKMEMAQQKKIMAKEGFPVVGWYAQTNTGCRMLGKDIFIWEEVPDHKIKHVKLITCPICKGIGTQKISEGFIRQCVVCNGSGITKTNYWNKWRQWQLDDISAEFSN